MTNLRLEIIHSLKLDRLAMRVRKRLGREFIPKPKAQLYIETSSICNLRCRFCAYRKKSGTKTTMDNSLFFEVIDEATDFGYDTFGLSPLSGEVLVSKDFVTKLEYLENHPKVAGYSFFTNFTLADEDVISRLVTLEKLKKLNISVYGHDRDSFLAITDSDTRFYDQLVRNLNSLVDKMGRHKFNLNVWWRTYSHLSDPAVSNSELSAAILQLTETARYDLHICTEYDNWGGYITPSDVEGLDVSFISAHDVFRCGACRMLFYKNIVLADGRVNACACRDVNASLVIGDLKTQSMKQIFSTGNKRYVGLIAAHQRGDFPVICRDCRIYHSIYAVTTYPEIGDRTVTLDEFYRELDR